MPFFERARWFELNYPLLIDVGRDFNVVFVTHLAGSTPIQDRLKRVEKHISIQAILDLSRAKAAYDDYTPSDKSRVTCLEGTRRVLLKEIGEWFIGLDESRIYLLSGQAGMGKTTVAQTVAERADNLGCLAASFFFSRDEADRRTAEKFLTTIAFQLCVYDERFSEAIGKVLATEKGAASLSKEPLKQVETLIIEPLRDILSMQSDLAPIVIVVDALDECDERDARNILLALDLLVKDLPSFKVMLTTRPDMDFLNIFIRPEMHQGTDFEGCTTPKVLFIQNIEDKVVDGDIRLYLKYKLSREQVITRLSMLREPWSASEHDIETLVLMSGRLFIIASTAVFFLLDTVIYDPASQMEWLHSVFSRDQTPFHALNDFYTTIIRRAVSTSCLPRVLVAERFQKVMGTIVLIREPLSIKALAALVGSSEDFIHGLLMNLQSVISLSSTKVPRIYHKSFSDFITDPLRCGDPNMLIDPMKHHTRIAIRCFQIMNNQLRRNIVDVRAPACFMENQEGLPREGIFDHQLNQKIPSVLRYACTYWAKHVEGARIKANELVKGAEKFANNRLLYWFETMSWIRKLNLAHSSLLVLVGYMNLPSSDLGTLLSDGIKFISRFYELIRGSALHTYYSALPFTPTASVLYRTYQNEMKRNFCRVEGGPKTWDALIASLPHSRRTHLAGGGPTNVSFSSDSRQLASWDGEKMKLWDTTSGTPISTFQGDLFALAQGSSTVASAQDDSVTVSTVLTKIPLATLKHSSDVYALAYSFDGSRLAAALSDSSVILWDVAKHEEVARIDGYSTCELWQRPHYKDVDSPAFMSFSPDGNMLAFQSTAGDLEMWDAKNGKLVGVLDHQARGLIEFTFSGDGSCLVSRTSRGDPDSYRLRLWALKEKKSAFIDADRWPFALSIDGSILALGRFELRLWTRDICDRMTVIDEPIAGWDAEVTSLAFSSECLAICMANLEQFSGDCIFALYDFRNRATITKIVVLDNHDILAFAPDGTRLVSWAWSDVDIHLWDVASIESPTSGHFKKYLTLAAHSPDCSRLALGFGDGTTELWSTSCRLEKVIRTYEDPDRDMAELAFSFSPDSKKFSIILEGAVRLCSSEDGTLIGMLNLPYGLWPTSVAFSSTLLAVATKDYVALWNLETLRPFSYINEGGCRLTFSHDSSTLAFGDKQWDLRVIKLWKIGKSPPVVVLDLRGSSRYLFDALKFSDDDRQFGILMHKVDRREVLVDVMSERIISDNNHEDLDWPYMRWNGIPVMRFHREDRLIGRFSKEPELWVPLVHFPKHIRVVSHSETQAAIALACNDGNVFFVRPSDAWSA